MIASAVLPPRLLTEAMAAEYLGGLPIAAMKRVQVGRVTIAGKLRWDRFALDAWLDALRSGAPQSPPIPAEDSPDAALARFLARQQGAERLQDAPRG